MFVLMAFHSKCCHSFVFEGLSVRKLSWSHVDW